MKFKRKQKCSLRKKKRNLQIFKFQLKKSNEERANFFMNEAVTNMNDQKKNELLLLGLISLAYKIKSRDWPNEAIQEMNRLMSSSLDENFDTYDFDELINMIRRLRDCIEKYNPCTIFIPDYHNYIDKTPNFADLSEKNRKHILEEIED